MPIDRLMIDAGALLTDIALSLDPVPAPPSSDDPAAMWEWFRKFLDKMTPEQRQEYERIMALWEERHGPIDQLLDE